MNTNDLRDVLDERSRAHHPEANAHLVLDGVHRRLRVRARRRTAATVAAAAVLVTAVGTLTVAHQRGARLVGHLLGRPPHPHPGVRRTDR